LRDDLLVHAGPAIVASAARPTVASA
jgi:hypothetical protein